VERFLFECAVRSTLIAAAAATVLWILRIKSAAARHAMWTGVLGLMLLLPLWTAWGPKLVIRFLPTALQQPPIDGTRDLFTPPIPPPLNTLRSHATTPPPAGTWPAILATLYVAGLLTLLLRLGIGTVRAYSLMRCTVPIAGRRSANACAAPITVGLFRPVIILPISWQQWSEGQLDAVLVHEQSHVVRRDPLVQWLALLNRALFWFHPLAWWLERRLSALAEEACDAAVIERGHDPCDYSAYLLDLTSAVAQAGRRINLCGMALPGSFLAERIRTILESGRISPTPRHRLTAAAVACAMASALFAAATLERKPAIPPFIPPSVTPLPGPPTAALIAQTRPAPPPTTRQEPAPPPGPDIRRFEVGSVKPSNNPMGGVQGGCRGIDSKETVVPLGRCVITDARLSHMIGIAWDVSMLNLKTGPDWIQRGDDRFNLEAKAEDPRTATEQDLHQMLQNFLVERFRLKYHRDQIKANGFALEIGKNAPKLKESTADRMVFENGKPARGRPAVMAVRKVPMATLAEMVSAYGPGPTIDRTGLTGEYDFTLKWDDNAGPTLSTALQEQLGLKLVPEKVTISMFVVDSAEKPGPN